MLQPQEQDYAPMGGCLYRVYWTLLGPGLLLVTGVALMANRARLGSILDFVYLGMLLTLIAARLLDPEKAVSVGRGKYVGGVALVAAALFLFAHFVAPKIL